MEKQNRSRAYPSIDLQEASEVLRKLSVLEWRERTRDEIAEALGYSSGSTGAAARKVAALGHFGFLRHRDKFYLPTELAERIARPSTRESLEAALRQAFMAPTLFREVLLKYEVLGRMPWNLADALADYGI